MPFLQATTDRQLFYQRIDGDLSKPCLVFLHEGLGCTQMWGDFPLKLCRATGCPGLIYDRLGYGRSSQLEHPWNIDYLHNYALTELPYVLASLIPDRPFILFGHSDGGSIGLIYASSQDPLLRGVVTEAAHVFVEPETVAGVRAAVAAWDKGDLKGLSFYHGENTESVFSGWSKIWLSDSFQTWSMDDLLPAIEIPLLAIQGVDDHYGTPKQLTAIAEKTAGKTKLVEIENCGHAPHREAQTEVLKYTTEFVQALS